MPIDYKQYHPKWKLISKFIRFYRAKNRCEWCGVPNYAVGYRVNGKFITIEQAEKVMSRTGQDVYAGIAADKKPTKIILTVAHIDHNKANNSFFNLAALCQACHLNHDKHHHKANRIRNRQPNQLSIQL